MNNQPPPQPQPPIFEVPESAFSRNKRNMAPLYLTNNRWDPRKSEERRIELQRQRALKEAEAKEARKKSTIAPAEYEKGIDLLIDLIDDNHYHPKPGEVTTDKVDF